MDIDGDMIICGGPYADPERSFFEIMAGTGKWKGIKGTRLHRRLALRTNHVGHKVKVTFKFLPK
jgi:hypothetical protein